MTFQAAAQRTVDSLFTKLGVEAVYTPNGGSAVDVTVIRRHPDEILDVAESRIHTETSLFEVRASEIAAPAADDQISVGDSTFVVKGEPLKDQHGLVWRLEAYPMEEIL